MEYGTVSIFELAFGVATGSSNRSVVLLVRAIAAIAAVSMMAGSNVDISTIRDQIQAQIAHEQAEIKQKPRFEISFYPLSRQGQAQPFPFFLMRQL